MELDNSLLILYHTESSLLFLIKKRRKKNKAKTVWYGMFLFELTEGGLKNTNAAKRLAKRVESQIFTLLEDEDKSILLFNLIRIVNMGSRRPSNKEAETMIEYLKEWVISCRKREMRTYGKSLGLRF